ncbi:hypothetical protein GCM10027563_25180 [Parasphingorhabdus pacifica]
MFSNIARRRSPFRAGADQVAILVAGNDQAAAIDNESGALPPAKIDKKTDARLRSPVITGPSRWSPTAEPTYLDHLRLRPKDFEEPTGVITHGDERESGHAAMYWRRPIRPDGTPCRFAAKTAFHSLMTSAVSR